MGPEGAANIIFRKEIAAAEDPEAERTRLVDEYSDSQFSSGVVAVVIGLNETGDTSVVEFDNFELRAP